MDIQVNKNWHYKTGALRLTFQIYDVLPTRIRAYAARPGLAKCGEIKTHKGR